MDQTAPETAPVLDIPTSHEEMDSMLGDLALERDQTARNSIHNRQAAVEALHQAGANGTAERIADILPKVDEQLAIKESFNANLESAESSDRGFMGRAWDTMKAHPYLTGAGIAALVVASAAGATYLAGGAAGVAAAIEKASAYVGLGHLYGAGEAAGGAGAAAESLGSVISEIGQGMPDYISGAASADML
jgi:hypothetical protein